MSQPPECTSRPPQFRSRPATPTFRLFVSKNTLIRPVFTVLVLFVSVMLVFPQARSDSLNSALQQFVTLASLELGKPIERELTGNENHSYTVTVAAGQYLLVQAEQRAIDLTLSVSDPNGKRLVETDLFRMGEPESLFFVAETAGTYRLEVKSLEKTATKGHYELKIKESRPATAEDSSAVAAQKLVADGERTEQAGTADLRRKAIEKYQQAIPLWQNAKDTAWEARTLCLIASDYTYLGQKQESFDFLNRALPLAESAVNRSTEEQKRDGLKAKAFVLDTTGRANQEFGDRKKALQLYNEALNLSRSIDDHVGEVNSLINLAKTTQLTGNYPKALELSEQARQMVNTLGDVRKEASVQNNMCMTYQSTGAYEQAFAACNRGLSIARDENDRWSEGNALINLGNTYYGTGDYQKTIDLYSQALEVYKSIGYGRGQAMTLNNIGYLYATLGDEQKSIDAYNQALEIFRSQGDQVRQAAVLNNLAINYSDKGDYRKALEMHLRLLPLRDAATNREGTAVTLENIAECYDHLGEKGKALDYYNQALTLVGPNGDPRLIATTLKNMGALYREQGNYQKALDLLNQARQTARHAGDKLNEGVALAQIAYVERARANYEEAGKLIEQALAEVESLRGSVKSPQLRATFLATAKDYYEFQTDILMRLDAQRPGQGFDAAALAASEKGRARSLLELLAESGAEIRQGVEPSLLEREEKVRDAIAEKAEQQVRLLSGQHTDEAADKVAKELDALTTEYEQVLARIRETSPRYAALTQPAPLNLKEIQAKVLDSETVLLEYALGDERSFLWAVTPTSINTFVLPKREQVETTARQLYELATERNRVVKGETLAQQRLRITRSDDAYQNAASVLSNMLLQPAASQLQGKRLLIVGDGVLQYVPFAALPAPANAKTPQTAQGYHPLVLDHEIVNLPSASVMAVLRQETAGRDRAPKTLAVLADPVFQRDDPRINQGNSNAGPAKTKPEQSANDVYRSAQESGLENFVRLRFTRNEADEIARLAPADRRLEALDFAASRANATSAALGQFQIVHFATHGLINSRHPELSGIVLSLVDEHGQPQNGFLRLYEIYNLKLSADLVVLSACQTALGEEISGEGLMGLTRGFMYAGSPRVVATLWQVDDRATSEMMKRFYQKMLGEGLRPVAALKAAQVSMQSDSRWRSPHYWAAFTLQGEWR